jgi:proline iminopeptidase
VNIKIPSRKNTPECELYVEIIRNSPHSNLKLGSEHPVMFMLPGGPGGNHTVYDGIKKHLHKFADLVLIDPRGCGLSSRSKAIHCTMDESAKDIDALRKELGIEKFILFGGSYGAMVSLNYAITYSSNLQALILVAGAPSGECFDNALETLKKIGTKEQIALTKKLFSGKIKSAQEKENYYFIMRNIYLAKNKDEHGADEDKLPTIRKLPYFLELSNFGHSTILPKYNVIENLCKISTPTLLLAGELDWINNVKYAYQMHELIPNSELVVFSEAGHFVWHGIEEKFYAEIENFISKLV